MYDNNYLRDFTTDLFHMKERKTIKIKRYILLFTYCLILRAGFDLFL